jgi:uncharacterized protein involved in exopolysaccharide biosynthesis
MTTIAQTENRKASGGTLPLARIRRHLRLFLTVFGVCFTAIAIGIALMPSRYESRMRLLVSSERQDLVISPNEGRTATAYQDFAENRVNSEIALMTSRDVLRDVVLKSGLGHEPGTVSAAGPPSQWYMDTAVNSLGNHLEISPIRKSDVIEVTYKAGSPVQANEVLKNLANSYLNEHLRAHAQPGSFEFFNGQANAFAEKLAASENELKQFQEQHALNDPSEKSALTLKALEAEALLDDATAQTADYEGRVKQAIHKMGSLDPRVTSLVRTTPQTGLITELSDKLADLQNRRTDLLMKFLPGDRLVKEVDQEIAETSDALAKAKAHPDVETTTDQNQVRRDVEKDLIESEVALDGLRARRARLASILDDYRGRLADVAAASTQDDALTRAVKENEQNYLLYSKEREEARIAASLDRQRITDVSLVEEPTYEVQPVSPKVKPDLGIGFLLSLMVAYLAVTVKDLYGRSSDSGPTGMTARA